MNEISKTRKNGSVQKFKELCAKISCALYFSCKERHVTPAQTFERNTVTAVCSSRIPMADYDASAVRPLSGGVSGTLNTSRTISMTIADPNSAAPPMSAGASKSPSKVLAEPPTSSSSPHTRLLDKRRQVFEVEEALASQKEEYGRKEDMFNRREESLRRKDLELQEMLIRFNQIITENESKRARAEKKAVEDKVAAASKEEEIATALVQLQTLRQVSPCGTTSPSP